MDVVDDLATLGSSGSSEWTEISESVLPNLSDDEDDEDFDAERELESALGSSKSNDEDSSESQMSDGSREEDSYLFCPACNKWSADVTCNHSTIFMAASSQQREIPDCLTVSNGAVSVVKPVEIGTLFGPYSDEGAIVDTSAASMSRIDYVWEVRLFNGKSKYLFDVEGNWMTQNVQRVRAYEHPLLYPVQYDGQLYYQALAPLFPGQILTVYWRDGMGGTIERGLGTGSEETEDWLDCCECPAVCESVAERTTHQKSDRHYPNDKYSCDECLYLASSRKHLWTHFRQSHTVRSFPCDLCSYAAFDEKHLERHRALKHLAYEKSEEGGSAPRRIHECDVCHKKFIKKHHLRNHKEVHSEPKFECKICWKRLRTPETLLKHISTVHPESSSADRFICPSCPVTFNSLLQLNLHTRKAHSTVVNKPSAAVINKKSPKMLKCRFCDKEFKYTKTRLDHERKAHPAESAEMQSKRKAVKSENEHSCPLCPATFKLLVYLREHMKRHNGECDHVCRFCNKGYIKVRELKQHMTSAHPDQEQLSD